MTVANIEYGTLLNVQCSPKLGILTAITNVFFKDEFGVDQTDAVLMFMRRSFGVGRTNMTLFRKDAWLVRDDVYLQEKAKNVADHLLCGTATAGEITAIADMILNNVEKLVLHPPEPQAAMIKAANDRIQRDGLLMTVNGKTLVDARS